MKFKLISAKHIFYIKYDRDEMEMLEGLGFVFDKSLGESDTEIYYCEDTTINIDTIAELIEFIEKVGEIIMAEDEIKIYNTYVE